MNSPLCRTLIARSSRNLRLSLRQLWRSETHPFVECSWRQWRGRLSLMPLLHVTTSMQLIGWTPRCASPSIQAPCALPCISQSDCSARGQSRDLCTHRCSYGNQYFSLHLFHLVFVLRHNYFFLVNSTPAFSAWKLRWVRAKYCWSKCSKLR